MGTRNPHDSFFRAVFSRPQLAADQFRLLLPPRLVEQLDLEHMRHRSGNFVDEDLADTASDVLFEVKLAQRDALIYVLYEHQSHVDPLMAGRMLIYMARAWAQHLRQNPDARRLPAIIPVLLHQGPQGWTACTELHDLIDLPEDLLNLVRDHVPSYRLLVDDLTKSSDDELEGRSSEALAKVALLLLRHARDRRELFLRALERVAGYLQQLEKSDQLLAGTYILVVGNATPQEIEQVLERSVPAEIKEAIMTAGEQLMQQGELRERRRNLVTALENLFAAAPLDPETTSRINSADGDQLDHWFERAFKVQSLPEVFSE